MFTLFDINYGSSMHWGVSQKIVFAQIDWNNSFFQEMGGQLGAFLPSLVWAIVLLLAGWVIATVAAAIVKNLLKRTGIDDRIANWALGKDPDQAVPIESWAATFVYWVILLFAIIAALNALNLSTVSEPLNGFLNEIFAYIPNIAGAALLLGAAWLVATVVRALVVQGLSRFNLDDRLAAQSGLEGEKLPFC
jgi:hypothetical protein